MWDYRAYVLSVVDGDTLRLLIDQGFYSRQEELIRLLDVSAPELHQPGGMETALFVKSWLLNNQSIVWPLRIVTKPNSKPEPTEQRSFTRYLATVYDISSGRCLNNDIKNFLNDHPEWGSGI